MLVRIAKLSAEGQIRLPVEVLRALEVDEGAEFVIVQKGEQIHLVPAKRAGKLLLDELPGWEALGELAFEELWDNEADGAWNQA